jgi:hypothetical protein
MAPTRPIPPMIRTPPAVARAGAQLLLLASLAFVPAAAATLGTLTAQSVRNEPLRAVVVLPRATVGDTPPSVRLALPAAYERLGFVRDPALATATVLVVTEPDGQRFARVDSDTPVTGAELVLLLETDGGIRRLYRLNLGSSEPADRINVRGSEPLVRGAVAQRTGQDISLPISAGANVREADPSGAWAAAGSNDPLTGAGASSVRSQPVTASGEDSAVATIDPGTAQTVHTLPTPIAPQARPDAITVAEGADLDTLARALRPPGATIEQSAAALWRANRAAFTGRPPRPIPGTLLQVPSEAAVLAIDPAEARAVVGGFAPEPVAVARASTTTATAVRAGSPTQVGSPAKVSPPAPVSSPTRVAAARAAWPVAATRDRVVLSAPSAVPTGSTRTPADVAFEAELAAAMQRIAWLERRLIALRAEVERSGERELALMRQRVDTSWRAGAPVSTPAPAPARGSR